MMYVAIYKKTSLTKILLGSTIGIFDIHKTIAIFTAAITAVAAIAGRTISPMSRCISKFNNTINNNCN